jgi:hypothetical protein
MDPIIPKKLYIINIGIRLFYETAIQQHIEAVHINWLPPPASEEIDKEIEEILNRIGDE